MSPKAWRLPDWVADIDADVVWATAKQDLPMLDVLLYSLPDFGTGV